MVGKKFVLFSLASIVLLCACTVSELAYEYADRLILQQIDARFGLSNTQELQALAAIQVRLYEHQQQELPQYANWLSAVRQAVSDQLTQQELNALNQQVAVLFQQGVRKTLPLFAGFLADLSSAQRDYLREETLEDYAERAEEIAEREPSWPQVERAENVIEKLEDWLGDLTDRQRQLVRQHVAQWPYSPEHWLQWREQRFLGLLDRLQTDISQQKIHAYLVKHWLDYQTMPESLAKNWQQSRQDYLSLLLALDATLSAEQRTRVIEKLDEWLVIVESFRNENIKPDHLK